LTLDRKTYRLQDEAPQGRQVSHEDTLSEERHRPPRSKRTRIADVFFGIPEVLFCQQVRQQASADAASVTPLFTMSKIANAGLC
jgi:hypothetical protein